MEKVCGSPLQSLFTKLISNDRLFELDLLTIVIDKIAEKLNLLNFLITELSFGLQIIIICGNNDFINDPSKIVLPDRIMRI